MDRAGSPGRQALAALLLLLAAALPALTMAQNSTVGAASR